VCPKSQDGTIFPGILKNPPCGDSKHHNKMWFLDKNLNLLGPNSAQLNGASKPLKGKIREPSFEELGRKPLSGNLLMN